MSFAMLFDAISNKIAPKDMKLVNFHYNLFRVRYIISLSLPRSILANVFLIFFLSLFEMMVEQENQSG